MCVTTGHVGAIRPKLYSGRPPLLADVQAGATRIPPGGCVQWQPVEACEALVKELGSSSTSGDKTPMHIG